MIDTKFTAVSEEASKYPIGALFAFVAREDAHSPVMAGPYEELEVYLEKQVPLHRIYADEEAEVQEFRVYSTPTLLWIRSPMSSDNHFLKLPAYNCEIMIRIVGVVNFKKLQHEADEILSRVLS